MNNVSMTEPKPDDPAVRLTAVQIQKLELEIVKLQEDLNRGRIVQTLVALTPLLSIVIGAAAFVFGIYQFQMQQNRVLVEQKRAEATAALSQQLELQTRIRDDVETLLRFFSDSSQTVSAASFRIENLKANLTIAASIPPLTRRVQFSDKRVITTSLVNAVEDDCNLDVDRDAAFMHVLINTWPDYSDFLRSHPDHAAVIATRYTDAAYELAKKAPEEFASVTYSSKDSAFIWSEKWGGRALAYKLHFFDLVLGFQAHVRLVRNATIKTRIVTRFAHGIGNDQIFSALSVD